MQRKNQDLPRSKAQQQQAKKSDMKFIIPIIVLSLFSLSLGGYIIYDKVANKPDENSNQSVVDKEIPAEDIDKDPTGMPTDEKMNLFDRKVAAFATVLDIASTNTDRICLGLTAGVIENSPLTPYQRIKVDAFSAVNDECDAPGGVEAWFYRVSPTAKWQFLGGGQEAFTCGTYGTIDAKKSFPDHYCYTTDSLADREFIKVESLL
jgi:hypothetical protein